MLTGTKFMNELVDELNELKLSTMAATLDNLYHRPGFLEMDRLTMIAELIGPQFQEKVSTTLKNRLTAAHLKGSPEELADCVDSDKRDPSHICLLRNMKEKSLAVVACDGKDNMSIRVPEGFLELHKSFKIHSKQFVYETLTGWGLDSEKTYSFKGEYLEEQKMVIFGLKNVN